MRAGPSCPGTHAVRPAGRQPPGTGPGRGPLAARPRPAGRRAQRPADTHRSPVPGRDGRGRARRARPRSRRRGPDRAGRHAIACAGPPGPAGTVPAAAPSAGPGAARLPSVPVAPVLAPPAPVASPLPGPALPGYAPPGPGLPARRPGCRARRAHHGRGGRRRGAAHAAAPDGGPGRPRRRPVLRGHRADPPPPGRGAARCDRLGGDAGPLGGDDRRVRPPVHDGAAHEAAVRRSAGSRGCPADVRAAPAAGVRRAALPPGGAAVRAGRHDHDRCG